MWLLLMMNVGFGQEVADNPTRTLIQSPQNSAFQVGVEPKIFVSFGAMSGVSMSSTNGGFVGVETAMSRVNGNRLVGLSADVLWDSGLGGVSAMMGPRVGLLMIAVDGGVGVRHNFDGTSEVGSQLRALCNLGIGSIYYRVGFWPESEELSTVHQLGISVKFPQQLGYQPRTGEG